MADDSANVKNDTNRALIVATKGDASEAPLFRPARRKFLELRHAPPRHNVIMLGILGAAIFIGVWEAGHYLTPEAGRRFLPSVEDVFGALMVLFRERNFLDDVITSCIRIFTSFFAAAAIAFPLGVLMGCFGNVKALLNPVLSGSRYLPASSFMPLLLVWFGPTDMAKLALLFIGVIFFLTALILDNVEAVPNEFVEASLTMGASRWGVVTSIVVPASAPAIIDSMRNMIAVGWTYLVIAEIVGAVDGIGAMMMRAGRTLSVDMIMAGILTIGMLGVLTDIVFRIAARFLLPWARAGQKLGG
ncbi:MAG: ABC transporter permease [Hyphomicrobiales bacterium]|nr:ABC transporter permease [Hyphomicrobiales bacterium]